MYNILVGKNTIRIFIVSCMILLLALILPGREDIYGQEIESETTNEYNVSNNIVRVTTSLIATVDNQEIQLGQRNSTGFFAKTSGNDAIVITALDAEFSDSEISEYREELESEKQSEADEAARRVAEDESESEIEAITAEEVSVNISQEYQVYFDGDMQKAAEPLELRSKSRGILLLRVSDITIPGIALSGTDAIPLTEAVLYGFPNAVKGQYSEDNVRRIRVTVADDADERKHRFRFMIMDDGDTEISDAAMRGSPVVSVEGSVIGILTKQGDEENYGYAIPIKYAIELMDKQGVSPDTVKPKKEVQEKKDRPRITYILALAAVFLVVFTAIEYLQDLRKRYSKRKKDNSLGIDVGKTCYTLLRVKTNDIIPVDVSPFVVGKDLER